MVKTRTGEEWLELIKRQRASGQSVRVWCAANGVNANSLTNAAHRLRKAGLLNEAKSAGGRRPKSAKIATPAWVEVLEESAPDAIRVEIGKFKIVVPSGFSEAAFLRVCKALAGIC